MAQVAELSSWLAEKVGALGSRLKLDQALQGKPIDDEWGDVDLFLLCGPDGRPLVRPPGADATRGIAAASVPEPRPARDAAASSPSSPSSSSSSAPVSPQQRIVLNGKWLKWLEGHVLREEDGFPRKSRGVSEDPKECGVVLQWIYGSIVSTTTSQLAQARRALGGAAPTIEAAHERLLGALAAARQLAEGAKAGRQLLADMIHSRKAIQSLSEAHPGLLQPTQRRVLNVRTDLAAAPSLLLFIECPAVPTEALLGLLKRKGLLLRAKLLSIESQLDTNLKEYR